MILRSTIIREFVRSTCIEKFVVQNYLNISERHLHRNLERESWQQACAKEASDDENDDDNSEVYDSENGGSQDSNYEEGGDYYVKADPTDPISSDDAGNDMKADVNGLVHAIAMCSVAGAYRYNGDCFELVNGKLYARPLLKGCCLPDIFRIHPMPMPNRALDVISVGFRSELVSDGTFLRCQTEADCRIKYTNDYRGHLIGTVFKSIILRFTGRLNAFLQYSMETKKDYMLPTIADIDGFLSFVRSSTLGRGGTQKTIARWISEQHAHSIPKETKVYTGFQQFVKSIGRNLEQAVDGMLVGNNRYIATTILRGLLLDCSRTGVNNRLFFLAHQVLSDVEEIFDDPFGHVTPESVHAGCGAEQGYVMLKNENGPDAPSNLNEALLLVVRYMQNEATNQDLDVTGYKKTGKEQVVRNKVNDRPFNVTDAEHFLCKLWVISKYTLPAYCISNRSEATKPHCHPVNLRGEENPKNPLLSGIMSSIVGTYENEMKDITPPEFCLLPNEVLPSNNNSMTE